MLNTSRITAGVIQVEESCRRIRALTEKCCKDNPHLIDLMKLCEESYELEKLGIQCRQAIRVELRHHTNDTAS